MTTRHIRSLCLLAATASLSLAGTVHAQSQDAARSPGWSLGIAAAWSPSPYKRYDNKAWPLPLVNYEGKSFYFRGASIGYRLFSTPSDEISIAVSPNGDRFRHEDTNDPQLKQLSNRNIGAMAGVAWRHNASWGFVEATANKKVTGHGGGTQFDLGYGYAITAGKLIVTPKIGITRSDSNLNNYYYGISAREAARSGLPYYKAGGGNSPYIDMSAAYRLTTKWMVIGGMRYSRLPDTIKNSPMVDADDTKSFFLAINRTFLTIMAVGIMRRIATLAHGIEPSRQAVWDWINNTPIEELEGRTALELVFDGQGERVVELLESIIDKRQS